MFSCCTEPSFWWIVISADWTASDVERALWAVVYSALPTAAASGSGGNGGGDDDNNDGGARCSNSGSGSSNKRRADTNKAKAAPTTAKAGVGRDNTTGSVTKRRRAK
eukprot:7571155-Pyramimonas_sp.AAC.1